MPKKLHTKRQIKCRELRFHVFEVTLGLRS